MKVLYSLSLRAQISSSTKSIGSFLLEQLPVLPHLVVRYQVRQLKEKRKRNQLPFEEGPLGEGGKRLYYVKSRRGSPIAVITSSSEDHFNKINNKSLWLHLWDWLCGR